MASQNKYQIIVHPDVRTSDYPPLLGCRKKKFYSKIPQPVNSKPDVRLIYKVDEGNNKLFILGIGLRLNERPVNPLDIYQRLKLRDQSSY